MAMGYNHVELDSTDFSAAYNGYYSVSSGDSITFDAPDDTVRIPYRGLLISSASGVFINLTGKVLKFNTSLVDTNYGIKVINSYDVHIKGGAIVVDPAPSESDTSYSDIMTDNKCIILSLVHDIEIDSVSCQTAGQNSNGLFWGNTSVFYNVEVYGGSWISKCSVWVNREDYDGSMINLRIDDQLTADSDSFNVKIYDIDTLFSYGQGIVVQSYAGKYYPKAFIYNNNVCGDARNYRCEWRTQSPGAESNRCSSANPYGIHLSTAGPSEVYGNTVHSGSLRGGCRGILIENVKGTPTNPVKCYNNNLDGIHEGPYAEAGESGIAGSMHALRIRALDSLYQEYIEVYGNTFTAYADSLPLSDTLTYGDTAAVYGKKIQICMFSMQYDNDSNISIWGNTFEAIALDSGVTQCCAFYARELTYPDNVLDSANTFISNLHPVEIGTGCGDYTFIMDTLEFGADTVYPTDDMATIHVEGSYSGEIIFHDCVFRYGTAENDVDYLGAATGEMWFKRTCSLYVQGSNDLPVVNAACTLWNAYDQLVTFGVTDNGGLICDTVTYYYDSNSGDSAAFNDFTFHAQYDTDKASNDAFTVGQTAAGATDTLTLTETEGTGEWGGGGEAETEKKISGVLIKGVLIK